MAVSRRRLLGAAAASLVAGCALQPPPTIAEQSARDAASQPAEPPSTGAPRQARPTGAPAPDVTPSTETPSPAESSTRSATPLQGSNHIPSASAYAVPAATVHQWLATRTGPATKTAFLTFDDGPSTTITPQVLDLLAQLGVHATFFLIGYRLLQAPDVARRAMAEGHAICCHSYSHDYSFLYPNRVADTSHVLGDFDQAVGVLRKVFGDTYAPQAYRYPGGHMSWGGLADADAGLAQRGVSWVDWNCMSGDAEKRPSTTTTAAMAMLTGTYAASGSPNAAVMLNHDSGDKPVTPASVGQYVQFFSERGYTFSVIG